AVLRPAVERGGRGEDQDADDAALRRSDQGHRHRPADSRVRSGAQREPQDLSAVHLRGRAARVPQRHDAALRRESGKARLAADDGVLQQRPSLKLARGKGGKAEKAGTKGGKAERREGRRNSRLTVKGLSKPSPRILAGRSSAGSRSPIARGLS